MSSPEHDQLVPDAVIPHKTLPPLRYRDLPEAPSWVKLVGPSVILAGLALGSGEFVFWPYITYRSGFVFFWACILGVVTQFFLNMEIERWTLATGESAITGFCRLSRAWAPIMLVMNVVPWIWPGWATGAGLMLSWSVLGAQEQVVESSARLPRPALPALSESTLGDLPLSVEAGEDPWLTVLRWKGPMAPEQRERLLGLSDALDWRQAVEALHASARKTGGANFKARYVNWLGIASLVLIGLLLTSSPVVYNTVERMQFWLVVTIFLIAAILGVMFIRPHALWAMLAGICNLGGYPAESSGLGQMNLLGALAFAGAGGTMNLGQSNFIKDKGYGMGRYIGRITSPLTGNEEAIADVGFHFPHTPENMRRWRAWWRAANCEHLFSFLLTCVVCLMLLALLSYSLFYDANGALKPGMDRFGTDMNFIWGQALVIEQSFASAAMGQAARVLFFIMGGALLLTTELGVLDATARISTDIIKVNFLRNQPRWTQSRLYFLLLWFEILVGAGILLASELNPRFSQPLFLLTLSAAMNGGVMMVYSVILLYLNSKVLSRGLSLSPLRFVALVWSCGFFGYFTLLALRHDVLPEFWKVLGLR
jgi:hypothetical protein